MKITQELIFDATSWFIVIALCIGFIFKQFYSQIAPYLQMARYWLNIYICLFLIVKFNPLLGAHSFNEFDKKISFSAGIILLMSSVMYK